jgi:hypothetical protein
MQDPLQEIFSLRLHFFINTLSFAIIAHVYLAVLLGSLFAVILIIFAKSSEMNT